MMKPKGVLTVIGKNVRNGGRNLGLMQGALNVFEPKGWFPLTRFWLRTLTDVNFNHVNEKLSEIQLLRIPAYARKNYVSVEIHPNTGYIFFQNNLQASGIEGEQ